MLATLRDASTPLGLAIAFQDDRSFPDETLLLGREIASLDTRCRYLNVHWKHEILDEPRWLYSELDDQRRERRKIDVFPDGRWGFADEHEEVGGSALGEAATPAVPDQRRARIRGDRDR